MLANNNMDSGTEEGLPLGRALPETKKREERLTGGGEAQAAAALGLVLEANRGGRGSLAGTREGTFDASAGRFPLPQS